MVPFPMTSAASERGVTETLIDIELPGVYPRSGRTTWRIGGTHTPPGRAGRTGGPLRSDRLHAKDASLVSVAWPVRRYPTPSRKHGAVGGR